MFEQSLSKLCIFPVQHIIASCAWEYQLALGHRACRPFQKAKLPKEKLPKCEKHCSPRTTKRILVAAREVKPEGGAYLVRPQCMSLVQLKFFALLHLSVSDGEHAKQSTSIDLEGYE